MKQKLLLLLLIFSGAIYKLSAQLLYSNNVPRYAFWNQGNIITGNAYGMFDDIEISDALAGSGDSLSITQVKFGIFRARHAIATSVNFYYSYPDDAATGLSEYLSIPPVQIGSVDLPANNKNSSTVTTITLGDGVTTLFKVPVKNTSLVAGNKFFFLGMKFSSPVISIFGTDGLPAIQEGSDDSTSFTINANGWNLSDGSQSPYANRAWLYDFTTHSRFAGSFIFGAKTVLNAEVFGLSTLPVTFLNFNGVVRNNQALLNWSVTNEINNKGFEVEKSVNGRDFSQIGFVQAKENTAGLNNYTFTDVKTNSGDNYYRVKQIDKDGSSHYSGVIQLKLNSKFGWSVYPNPVASEGWLQLQLAQNSKVTVQVVSSDGKSVQVINKGLLSAGAYSIPLNINKFPRGTYFVKLIVDDKVCSQSIIK